MNQPLEALQQAVDDLRRFVDRVAEIGLEVDAKWMPHLTAIESRITQRPEVAVALLGGTGAGKSTLVNAVTESRLLPVASMRVTTAAITEVAYGEGKYTADVEFVDREAWMREVEFLAADIRDAREAWGGDGDDPDLGISKAAEDKIRLVYGERSAEAFFEHMDLGLLREPAQIAAAFDSGLSHISTPDHDDFRLQIKGYIDSSSHFWPIVKRLRIRGPFPKLVDGAVLVDLPGLNDPNESRERATREHLQTAQFVWVVFNMKRALTRDVFDFLREDDVLRRLFVDGRTGSMTLVGTASDDIDFDNDIDEFELEEDAETLEIVEARNRAVEGTVRSQLEELSVLLAREAREQVDAASELITQVKAAPVFCVSAREYQKCIKIMTRRNHIIDDADATQIPALQDHLTSTVANLGHKAHIDRLWTELELVRSDVLRLIRTRLGSIRAERQTSQAQMEGVRAAATQAHTFLGRSARSRADEFSQAMYVAAQLLEERLRSVSVSAVGDLREVRDLWRMMAWNTLKATARRGGRWVARDRSIDIPGQIAKPMIQGVTFAWVDFFGAKSEAALDVLEGSLRTETESYLRAFRTACQQAPGLLELFDDYGKGVSETTRKLIDDEVSQLRSQIDERLAADRRQLHQQVTDQISAEMKSAFDRAAEEKGKGMRDRMVQIIYSQASETAEVMFSDVRHRIEQLLRDLLRFLENRVEQLTGDVIREAEALIRLLDSEASTRRDSVGDAVLEDLLDSLASDAPVLREVS